MVVPVDDRQTAFLGNPRWAIKPQQGGVAHGCLSKTPLFQGLLGTEELANHRMHFHGLFLLNLLVGSQDDTDGQQQARAGRITHRTQQVCAGGEQPDKRAGKVGHGRNVVLEDLLQDLWVLSEPGNLHARALDLLGNVLRAHVGGVNPELGENHRTDGHQGHVKHHVDHDLRQRVTEHVALLIQQRNEPVVHAVDHAGVPGKPS